MIIQVAWTEPFMSLVLGVRREVFPVLAFLGEAIILYKLIFENDNLHQMEKSEEKEEVGE